MFAGGFLGGVASGLTGFGFALSSLPVWALALPPAVASPLVLACSVVAQLQTLPSIWHAIDFRRLAVFVIPGIVGIPLGVMLLPKVSPEAFRLALGIALVVTCGLLLWLNVRVRRESTRAADAAVGFAGGVLGGLAGLSGVLPTLWAEVHGWGKDERRAIFQGFNLSILALAFIVQAVAGVMTLALAPLLLIAIPAAVAGAWVGRWLYDRVDAKRFSRIILVLLMLAGAGLVAGAVAKG